MPDVAVIGASMTKFGQRETWVRELLTDAGIRKPDSQAWDGYRFEPL